MSRTTSTRFPFHLSLYGRAAASPSPVNRMMTEFASNFRDGVDINLGVGFVNERTIPTRMIHKALTDVVAHPLRYRLAFNYGSPTGSENLVGAIRRYLVRECVGMLTEGDLADRNLIIGPNGASSLLESIAYVLPTGIVVTSDPRYYIYTDFLERLGFDILSVPEDAQGMVPAILDRKISARRERAKDIRFIYLATVNNPTCTILSNSRRRAIVQAAEKLSRRLGRAVPVVFDRAYEELVHDPEIAPLESALRCDRYGLVYEVGTLSKVLAPALRIGYLIGRNNDFMRALVQRTSDAGFSAPMITQEMAGWLLDRRLAAQLRKVRKGYRSKAQAVRSQLQAKLGDEIDTLSGGSAGFYYYLTLKHTKTHEGSAFFRYLTRTTGQLPIDGPTDERNPRVIYIPGEHCVQPGGDLANRGLYQLRLSYGFENLGAIRKAIDLMKEAVTYAKG